MKNGKVPGKIKRYCVKGNKAVFVGIAIAGVIAFVCGAVQGMPLVSAYNIIVLAVCAPLCLALYLVGLISVSGTFKARVAELEKLGLLDSVMRDLESGDKYYGGVLLIGKRAMAVKGYGLIFLLEDIDSMYLTDRAKRDDEMSFLYAEVKGEQYSIAEVPERKQQLAEEAIAEVERRKSVL